MTTRNHRLTNEPGKTMLQDQNHPRSATTHSPATTQSLTTTEQSRLYQPTLLGIPQEMLDKIFEEVYEPLDTAGEPIGLFFYGPYWGTECRAAVVPSQAPPLKDSLLVCRRLYVEMGSEQATAFYRCWENNKSQVIRSDESTRSSPMLHAVAGSDLMLAMHFSVPAECLGLTTQTDLHFQVGQWCAFIDVFDALWDKLCHEWQRRVPAGQQQLALPPEPQSRQCVDAFEDALNVVLFCERAI
jgi:hypothetical protein